MLNLWRKFLQSYGTEIRCSIQTVTPCGASDPKPVLSSSSGLSAFHSSKSSLSVLEAFQTFPVEKTVKNMKNSKFTPRTTHSPHHLKTNENRPETLVPCPVIFSVYWGFAQGNCLFSRDPLRATFVKPLCQPARFKHRSSMYPGQQLLDVAELLGIKTEDPGTTTA